MANETENRIYVIVPQTVQVIYKGIGDVPPEMMYPEDDYHPEAFVDTIESFPMVSGRLIAQGVHIGRLLGYWFSAQNIPYQDITIIVLSVRNSKELKKVSDEIISIINSLPYMVAYKEFNDKNPTFYNTDEAVHTITAVGPISKEILDTAIGHLELY